MGTPKGNGLVEITGSKEPNETGFFCFKLVTFLNEEEEEPGSDQYGDLWEARFKAAKEGACVYRDRCPIYAKTKERLSKETNDKAK